MAARHNAYAGQVKTLSDAARDQPRRPNLVNGVLVARSLNIFYGSPGSLKTNLLLDLCISVATGTCWLPDQPGMGSNTGYPVTQAPVLLIDLDNGEDVIAERLAAFARGHNAPNDAPLHFLTFPDPPLIASKGLNSLTEYAMSIQAGLIVIDNLLRVAGVRDENSSEIDSAMLNLRKLAEMTHAVLVLIHHRRKDTQGREGDSLRGHSSIEAGVDIALLVERSGDVITVKCTKARRKPVETFGARWTHVLAPDGETLHEARFWRAQPQDRNTMADADLAARIRAALAGGPMNQSRVAQSVGGNKARVIAVLRSLAQAGQVATESGDHNATIYRLA